MIMIVKDYFKKKVGDLIELGDQAAATQMGQSGRGPLTQQAASLTRGFGLFCFNIC